MGYLFWRHSTLACWRNKAHIKTTVSPTEGINSPPLRRRMEEMKYWQSPLLKVARRRKFCFLTSWFLGLPLILALATVNNSCDLSPGVDSSVAKASFLSFSSLSWSLTWRLRECLSLPSRWRHSTNGEGKLVNILAFSLGNSHGKYLHFLCIWISFPLLVC